MHITLNKYHAFYIHISCTVHKLGLPLLYIAVLHTLAVVKVRILTGLGNAMLQQFVQKSLSYNIRSVG